LSLFTHFLYVAVLEDLVNGQAFRSTLATLASISASKESSFGGSRNGCVYYI
jgi:hypothetical protein